MKFNFKFRFTLSSCIFIALITGFIVGLLIHYFMPDGYVKNTILIDGIFNVLGNGFIRGMRMLVVPLVFCSIVCGTIGIGDLKRMGRL